MSPPIFFIVFEDSPVLTFADYEALAASTAVYPREAQGLYPLLGLLGEAAELAAKLTNYGRPGAADGLLREEIADALSGTCAFGSQCEKCKKLIRGTRPEAVAVLVRNSPCLPPDGDDWEAARPGVSREIGDVLWYLAALCRDYGLTLADCAEGNLVKLKLRKETGTLHGVGDDRELAQAATNDGPDSQEN